MKRSTWLTILGIGIGFLLSIVVGGLLYLLNRQHRF
jgi:ABC-type antimicrobial peptide transport system permease subunit